MTTGAILWGVWFAVMAGYFTWERKKAREHRLNEYLLERAKMYELRARKAAERDDEEECEYNLNNALQIIREIKERMNFK